MKPNLLFGFLLLAGIIAGVQPLNADPIQWLSSSGGNDHYYEVVSGHIDWLDANATASAMQWVGLQGHLATLASPEENQWVWTTFQPCSYWFGAYQDPGGSEPAGGWGWVTGEDWSYQNWSADEPNEAHPDEDYALFFGACDGTWNDRAHHDVAHGSGFVVEYESASTAVEMNSWGRIKRIFR